MRSEQINGIFVGYPEKLAFAFNPCLCYAVSGSGGNVAWTETTCGEHTLKIHAHHLQAHWDIRELLQAAIRDKSLNGDTQWQVEYTIRAYRADGTLLAEKSAESFTIWGALHRGETWNTDRRLYYFEGYPFDFQVYLAGREGKLVVYNDGRPDGLLDTSTYEGLYKFQLPETPAPAKERYEVRDFTGVVQQVTFDESFDLTFRYKFVGREESVMVIDVMDTQFEYPVYLRWINRHGFTSYWLFRGGEQRRQIEAQAEYVRNNLQEVNASTNLGDWSNRRRAYGRTDTQEICAPMVDREQFDFLQDLTSSPCVDLYHPETKTWEAVTIAEGTYTKTTEQRQDFTLTIAMQEYDLQRL